MKSANENQISMLIRHCRMYLYGSKCSPEMLVNDIAQDFYNFSLLHLTCTMFITTDQKNSPQGIFHRILDPLHKRELLADIDIIFDSPIGNTTLRQFIRSKRNKLATHGLLDFSSQPKDVQNITFNKNSLQQYQDAMFKLDKAVSRLEQKLCHMLSEKDNH